ncbi:MAG: GNAT family N-acetyltransferase [Chitinophagales bacterium]
MYKYHLKDGLPDEIFMPVKNIFDQCNHRFFYQDPEWLRMEPDKKKLLIVTDSSNSIIAYAALETKKLRTIHLSFGPVTLNEDDLPEIIAGMAKWLKEQGWWRLTIQLAIPVIHGGDHIVSKTRELAFFRQSSNLFNWKSWWLALDQEPEQLMKSFSHHHLKSVRQGLKQPITFLEATTDEQALMLASLYIEMYRKRKLPVNENDTRQLFSAVNNYIQQHKKGIMLEAVLDGRTVGGIVIIFQGNTAYYYLGVTTISYKRSIPILYAAFFHVMAYCRKSGISTLDFGGIAGASKEGESLHNINRFKMGFGGNAVNYPGLMVFDLNPLISRSIEKGMQWRNQFRKWKERK